MSQAETKAKADRVTDFINDTIKVVCVGEHPMSWMSLAAAVVERNLDQSEWDYMFLEGIGVIPRFVITRHKAKLHD